MRHPVHVVYGGAHLFKADTCQKLGKLAERIMTEYAPDPQDLPDILGFEEEHADKVYERVLEKLRREPVEDFRIDFEDGFGARSDDEEDAAAHKSAKELAKAMADGVAPPFSGFRIKPLTEEYKDRGFRTLELFLGTLMDATSGKLPPNFVVTLPKVTVVEQVEALMYGLDLYPRVKVEIMIETPQALDLIPQMLAAANGRCVGAHFGPFDYMSSLGISSANASLLHPACDFARSTMQAKLAGTGIAISDGPTNVLPVPLHKGDRLTEDQKAANQASIQNAWEMHYSHIRTAIFNGIYQGWDLHPGQLPIRYLAVYLSFLEELEITSQRLKNFVAKAGQATTVGDTFDDAATAWGLIHFFRRAVSCGAIPESEIPGLTGLTMEKLRSSSFAQMVGK